jgi:integrase
LRDKISNRPQFRFISLFRFADENQEYVDANFSKSYARIVKISFSLIKERLGDIPLNRFSFMELEKFFTETYQRTKQGARTYLIALKSAFNKAILWDYLDQNPFNKIKLPKIPKNNPSFIDEIELSQIVSKENNETLKQIYLFAFYTGMRLGEITNLKWNQVSFSERIIRVMNTDEFTTKGKRERIVPLNDKVFNILSEIFPKIISIQKDGYVFNKNRFMFNPDYISKNFKKAVRESAKENLIDESIHFHDLRHSFASNLAKRGVSLLIIKELLGHTDIKTTMIYAHLRPENLRNAVELLN